MEPFKIFDHLFGPIMIVSKKMELLHFNHEFVIFSKSPPRILKGTKNIFDIVATDSINIKEYILDTLEKDEIILTEELKLNFHISKEATYYGVLKFIPYYLSDRNCIIICFHDLSVEHNLYEKYRQKIEELTNTHEQILQADKLATLGEITASISHEISNPLTIANGHVELIESWMDLDLEDFLEVVDQCKNSLSAVKQSIERINLIVTGMKSFIHKSEDDREYCYVGEIVESCTGLLKRHFYDNNVELETIIYHENLVLLVNKIKIEQVIVNLLKNAFDEVYEKNIEQGKIILTVDLDGESQNVIIEVADNGLGVPIAHRDKIFETFFTTKALGKGTGLGLAVCKKIIDAHHGKLVLDPNVKQGSKFSIKLPVLEISSYTHNEKILTGLNSNEGKKILCINDHVETLTVVNKYLEEEGYVFIGSTDAAEGVKFIDKIDIDLVLIEYQMKNGISENDFLDLVGSTNRKVPVIYIGSSKNIQKFHNEKNKEGVAGIILRPFNKDEILKTINLVFKDD